MNSYKVTFIAKHPGKSKPVSRTITTNAISTAVAVSIVENWLTINSWRVVTVTTVDCTITASKFAL